MNGCLDCKHNVCGIDHTSQSVPLRSTKTALYSYEQASSKQVTNNLSQIDFFHINYSKAQIDQYPWLSQYAFTYSKKGNDSQSIVVLFISNKNNKNTNKTTLVYSHDTFNDLGSLYSTLIYMSYTTKCNILSYDYCGFGLSKGVFDVNEFVNDSECVNEVLKYFNIPFTSVVLLGQSLGVMPSFYLASTYNQVKGMIVMSLFSNKMEKPTSIEQEDKMVEYFGEYLENIECPCFIIHGLEDMCVHKDYSIKLNKYLTFVDKWFPKRGSHTNLLEQHYLQKFVKKIKEFIESFKPCNEIDDVKGKQHCKDNIIMDEYNSSSNNNNKDESDSKSEYKDSERKFNDDMLQDFIK